MMYESGVISDFGDKLNTRTCTINFFCINEKTSQDMYDVYRLTVFCIIE